MPGPKGQRGWKRSTSSMLAGRAARSIRRRSARYCAASVPAIGCGLLPQPQCARAACLAIVDARRRRSSLPFAVLEYRQCFVAIASPRSSSASRRDRRARRSRSNENDRRRLQTGRAVVVKRAAQFAVDQRVRRSDCVVRLVGGLQELDCRRRDELWNFKLRGAHSTAQSVIGAGCAGPPCSSAHVCVASPQLRPNFRSTRIGTSSVTASQPRRATSSPCSRVDTEQSSASCICNSGTMPSRQQARIHSLV